MTQRHYRFVSKDGQRKTEWKSLSIAPGHAIHLPDKGHSLWLGEKYDLEIVSSNNGETASDK